MNTPDYLAEDYNAVRDRRLRALDQQLGYETAPVAYGTSLRNSAAIGQAQGRYLRGRAQMENDLSDSSRYDQFYSQNKLAAYNRANPPQYTPVATGGSGTGDAQPAQWTNRYPGEHNMDYLSQVTPAAPYRGAPTRQPVYNPSSPVSQTMAIPVATPSPGAPMNPEAESIQAEIQAKGGNYADIANRRRLTQRNALYPGTARLDSSAVSRANWSDPIDYVASAQAALANKAQNDAPNSAWQEDAARMKRDRVLALQGRASYGNARRDSGGWHTDQVSRPLTQWEIAGA